MKDFEGKAYYPIDLEALPKGWTCAFVGEVCAEVQSGFASGEHNSAGKGVPHLRPMNIDRAGHLDMSVIKSVAAKVDARRLHRGDVLFNNTNSPVLVGKTAAVSRDGDLAFSNHMTRLRPLPELDYEFLAHHLHYLWMGGYFLHRCSKHVNQASISTETLAVSVPLVVPHACEQREIVSAVDSYMTRLDDAIASLERVQAKLKAYRASVLKAAVEGHLVPAEAALARVEKRDYEPAEVLLGRVLKERRRCWENAELVKLKAAGNTPKDDKWKTKYQEPVVADASTLACLPEGWCWATMDQLTTRITSGSRDWTQYYGRGSAVFLMAQNVRPGRLDLSFRQLVDPPGDDPSCDRSRVEVGDVLVTIVGANTGNVCRVSSDLSAHYVCQSVALMRPVNRELSAFIETYLNSPIGESIYKQFMYGQGRPHLSFDQLRETPVALPPLAELRAIASVVEAVDSVVAAVSNGVRGETVRCSRLRQAVLKWAFEGKLVDQDPNGEPAEQLLARLRAERAIVAPSMKSRGRIGMGSG